MVLGSFLRQYKGTVEYQADQIYEAYCEVLRTVFNLEEWAQLYSTGLICLGVFSLIFLLDGVGSVSEQNDTLRNWIFDAIAWSTIVSLVVGVVLWLVSRRKMKKVMSADLRLENESGNS
jgi:protein-S-isoprenylcysteine O-methyltransferase Ste14